MIPHVTKGGRSFKGAFKYYMHDQGTDTRERIDWTHTHNLNTDNPDKAWKIMAYFAMSQDRLKEASGQKTTGRKTEKPVLAYSLSWHPNENPDKDHMLEVAMASIKKLELQDYQAVVIAHRDTPHKHCHVIVNRIHPETGLVASNSHSHRKLSSFAREYQLEQGMDYCPQREENHQKREKGEPARHHDKLIQEAWNISDNGKTFIQALSERGYSLARGRKRLVVVDAYGKAHNPTRLLDGVKAKDFRAKTSDIDQSTLPDADELSAQIEKKRSEEKRLRLEQKAPKLAPEFNEASKEPLSKISPEFERAAQPKKTEEQVVEIAPTVQPKPANESKAETIPDKVIREIASALNRTQDRHIRELGSLSDHHHRLINREKRDLADYYDLKIQKKEIARLKKKTASPSWWRKLFGLAKRDRQNLQQKVLGYKSSRNRYQERIQTLKNNYKRELEKLIIRQRKEWKKQQELAAQKEQSRYWKKTRNFGRNKESPGPHFGPELE